VPYLDDIDDEFSRPRRCIRFPKPEISKGMRFDTLEIPVLDMLAVFGYVLANMPDRLVPMGTD